MSTLFDPFNPSKAFLSDSLSDDISEVTVNVMFASTFVSPLGEADPVSRFTCILFPACCTIDCSTLNEASVLFKFIVFWFKTNVF